MPGGETYYHLTLETEASTHAITLEGNVQAYHDGDVQTVRTNLFTCDTSVALADCHYGGTWTGAITETTLATPVEVKKNQYLYVSVELSVANATS